MEPQKAVRAALRIARAVGGPAGEDPVQPYGTAYEPHQAQISKPYSTPSIKTLADAFNGAIEHHRSLPFDQRVANSKIAAARVANHIGWRQDGTPVPLLGKNMKLMKSEKGYEGQAPVKLDDGRGVETTGLALAPAYTENKFTTCPNSASCKNECLGKTAGMYFAAGGGKDLEAFKGPRLNSLKKTQAMMRDPHSFAVRLHDEIQSAKDEAAERGNHLGVRLNVLSDIHPRVHEAIIKAFPDVDFYDYTKNNTNPIAPNHHYTYSSTGLTQRAGQNGLTENVPNEHSNWKQMRKRLDTGSNVAMAFSNKNHLPERVYDIEGKKTYRVVDGDTHDFRPLDIQSPGSPGVIVGLRNKKKNIKEATSARDSKGFFVHYDPRIAIHNGKPVKDPETGETMPTNRLVTIGQQGQGHRTLNNDLEAKDVGQ